MNSSRFILATRHHFYKQTAFYAFDDRFRLTAGVCISYHIT
ncbi:hypothetical protein BSBH6_00818 [Bacillus subtilis]|nr:hypothetical protein BSBH6_00818 [Bacillus subtilis]RPK27180.1 hypothetical protein BH5_00816 [Bacillus subtilis]